MARAACEAGEWVVTHLLPNEMVVKPGRIICEERCGTVIRLLFMCVNHGRMKRGALVIGRNGQAVVATAVAGFIFALGPGHNIPLIGGTPGVGKEVAIMTVVIVVSAVVLVEVHARLSM